MGWLVDRAKERQRNLSTAGTIASFAWKLGPVGVVKSQEALANRLRALEEGKGEAWWLEAKGRPYLEAVAAVLKVTPDELASWIKEPRASQEDAARWFRFEAFPRLRPLDLDAEAPFPGVPDVLWREDGPRDPTWWHAPPGAGRTLVGRLLARRHGWTFVRSPRDLAARTFIELDAADLPDAPVQSRVVVAAPHPMPERLKLRGWREVRGDPGWEVALLEWVKDRIEPGGLFDPKVATAAFAEGRLPASTPGALIEGLAELDALGDAVLSDQVPARRVLSGWAQAHAGRPDRAVGPASRDWLRENGAWLLPQIELERLSRGLPVTFEDVLACMPELPSASADKLHAAIEAGDRDSALAMLRPGPDALVNAMAALRWLLPGDWGLPSRVLGLLRALVVELALDERVEIHVLGALLNTREVASEVVQGLATPARLAAWTQRLKSGDAADPRTALVADGLLKAFALLAAKRAAPVDGLARDLTAALRAVYGVSCPDLCVTARIDGADDWTSIVWLTLVRLGVGLRPTEDQLATWAFYTERALLGHTNLPIAARPLLMALAAETMGAIVHAEPGWRWTPPAVAAVVALASGEMPESAGLFALGQVRSLNVQERLCEPWAASTEEMCRLLWPVWREWGIPDEPSPAKLAQVWATYPSDQISGRLSVQLVEHAIQGVQLPERLWRLAITAEPGQRALLERAPIDILCEFSRRGLALLASVVWARAPERALAVLADILVGEETPTDSSWIVDAPADRALDVLQLIERSASPSWRRAARRCWADPAIRARVPGWEKVWAWARAEQAVEGASSEVQHAGFAAGNEGG